MYYFIQSKRRSLWGPYEMQNWNGQQSNKKSCLWSAGFETKAMFAGFFCSVLFIEYLSSVGHIFIHSNSEVKKQSEKMA